jgi:hypothetical protein
MNKWFATSFAAALFTGAAIADVGAPAPTAKDMSKTVDEVYYVETSQPGIVLGGYVDAGYTYNFTGAPTAYRSNGATDGLQQGDFSLNALKLSLAKDLSDENVLQAGFRADLKIGEDAQFMGGAGNGVLGSSDSINLDQAFVVVRVPVGNGLDISAGKFASLLGYEVDDRPANINISYGYDWFFVTTQQTGVKAYYPINDIVEVQFAVTNGSALDTSSSFVGNSDDYGINATVNFKNPGGNANWFHGVYYSTSAFGTGFSSDNEGALIYNTWGNWSPTFAHDKLLLAFSATIGDVDDDTPLADDGYTFWTGSLYAKYQLTDIVSLGGRGSYVHSSDEGNTFGFVSQDAWSLTGTVGFDLLENFMVRGEYRVDIGEDVTGASDAAHMISMQAVYSF